MKKETIVVRVANDIKYEDRIGIAEDVLKRGGVVVFPTDTVYGMGVLSDNSAGIEEIYSIKGRDSDKPLILMTDKNDVPNYAEEVSEKARELMEQHWPGALTVILRSREGIPEALQSREGKIAKIAKIAIRMPDNEVVLSLIRRTGKGLATTSANLSGEKATTDSKKVIDKLFGKVDLILDAGFCGSGQESTIVDASGWQLKVLRQGQIKI